MRAWLLLGGRKQCLPAVRGRLLLPGRKYVGSRNAGGQQVHRWTLLHGRLSSPGGLGVLPRRPLLPRGHGNAPALPGRHFQPQRRCPGAAGLQAVHSWLLLPASLRAAIRPLPAGFLLPDRPRVHRGCPRRRQPRRGVLRAAARAMPGRHVPHPERWRIGRRLCGLPGRQLLPPRQRGSRGVPARVLLPRNFGPRCTLPRRYHWQQHWP